VKIRTILPALFALMASSAALPGPAAAAPAGKASAARSCHLPGAEESLRCLSVSVPLDYAKPDSASLKLHVTVAPAFRPRRPARHRRPAVVTCRVPKNPCAACPLPSRSTMPNRMAPA